MMKNIQKFQDNQTENKIPKIYYLKNIKSGSSLKNTLKMPLGK